MTKEIKHGTLHAYQHHACRCDDCKAVNSAYHKQRRDKARMATDDQAQMYDKWATWMITALITHHRPLYDQLVEECPIKPWEDQTPIELPRTT